MKNQNINEIIKLFGDYVNNSQLDKNAKEIAQEAMRGLNLIQFSIDKVKIITKSPPFIFSERDIAYSHKNIPNIKTQVDLEDYLKNKPNKVFSPKDTLAIIYELDFFIEGFYYQAFRCGKYINLLPGLSLFTTKKYKGVCTVRNNLIEHAERKDSRIFNYSLSFGGDEGPKYKFNREGIDNKNHEDSGMYENLNEFLYSLRVILENYSNNNEK